MKLLSIITPCYNEEGNVELLYQRTRETMAQFPGYEYEHIFIDNDSRDGTVDVLRRMAARDRRVKVIVNARNFGHLRSPMHALMNTRGDAAIAIAADLQDPPELIGEMIREWEQGTPIVVGVKTTSAESKPMFQLRTVYYKLIARLTDIKVIEHCTGFGLYDRRVLEILRKDFRDPYPYFRGMIAEIGLPYKTIEYHQTQRYKGVTKNNFYTLYDLAMLGITNLSKVPLRALTFTGFISSVISLGIGMAYLIYKLMYWNRFSGGVAPVLIGLAFLGSLQLIALGVIGEYIGAIHTLVQDRPLVIEKERINFDVGDEFAADPAEARTLRAVADSSVGRR